MFKFLNLSEDGVVSAKATGHPTDVLAEFHGVCTLLLGGRGAWRITEVGGTCSDEMFHDSEMEWILLAKVKP